MEEKLKENEHFERRSETVTKPVVQGSERSEYVIEDDTPKILEKIDVYTIMQQLIEWGQQGLAEEGNLREFSMNVRDGVFRALKDDGRQSNKRLMLENPWLFEEPNSVAGFNDSNKLYEAQKEIGKLIKKSHDKQEENIMLREVEKTVQRRAEEAEKQVAKLREDDEKKQHELNVLQNEIKNLRSVISKKGEKIMKLEKHNAKILEENVASKEAQRVALRRAQAKRDATSKKQSAKNENLQKVNNELKKKIKEINMSRENEQALNAAAMKSLEEKLVAKMTVEKEDHTANVKIMEGKYGELTIKVEELEKDLQRKCEVIEVLQQTTEEKENMDTTKANEVDSEQLNAVSDDEEKPVGQEDFVQQLKKTVPKASEPKVSEDDQRVRVVKEMDLKSIGLKDSNESLEPETKNNAKKDYKDKMRHEQWKPKQEVRPDSVRPEEYEEKFGPDIAALLLTGKYSNGDAKAKILRYNSRKKRG